MPAIFDKLNLKDQTEMLVLNAPISFEPELAALKDLTILRQISEVQQIRFGLFFVTRLHEIETLAEVIAQKVQGDGVIWFAYPKGTSRKYHCEFNRDTGWTALHQAGFDPVRQVAIDEDWSALRFRRVEYIKRK